VAPNESIYWSDKTIGTNRLREQYLKRKCAPPSRNHELVTDDLHPNSKYKYKIKTYNAPYVTRVIRRRVNSDTNPSSDSTFEKCQGRVACRTESCQKIWKMAEVLPIPKFHPPMSIQSDLRSISQTPTISKQLEATVGNWIMGYVRGKRDN